MFRWSLLCVHLVLEGSQKTCLISSISTCRRWRGSIHLALRHRARRHAFLVFLAFSAKTSSRKFWCCLGNFGTFRSSLCCACFGQCLRHRDHACDGQSHVVAIEAKVWLHDTDSSSGCTGQYLEIGTDFMMCRFLVYFLCSLRDLWHLTHCFHLVSFQTICSVLLQFKRFQTVSDIFFWTQTGETNYFSKLLFSKKVFFKILKMFFFKKNINF